MIHSCNLRFWDKTQLTYCLGKRFEANSSEEEFYYSTFVASYSMRCNVGMHVDSRATVHETIDERYSTRFARLSETVVLRSKSLPP